MIISKCIQYVRKIIFMFCKYRNQEKFLSNHGQDTGVKTRTQGHISKSPSEVA